MTQTATWDERLEAARLAQSRGARVSSDLRSLRMTIAMPLSEAVWAADAQARSSELPVLLADGYHTFGRVVDTTLAQDDRTILHATIEVDL